MYDFCNAVWHYAVLMEEHMGKCKVFLENKIVKHVLWDLFFLAIVVVIILSFVIKPGHKCVVCGQNNASEYEYQVGSKKLNGRTFKEFEKVHLCKTHLNDVKNGKIKLLYNKDTKTFSYKTSE